MPITMYLEIKQNRVIKKVYRCQILFPSHACVCVGGGGGGGSEGGLYI